jgi:hypothetical protein
VLLGAEGHQQWCTHGQQLAGCNRLQEAQHIKVVEDAAVLRTVCEEPCPAVADTFTQIGQCD